MTLVLALGAGGGCGRDAAAPQLLTVEEVAPLVLGEGEALEVRGAGFAPKRGARVTFRGALHRPGAEPDPAWSASAEGVAESSQRLVVAVPEALRARFCGAAASAVHATFRGEVDVAFEPLTPGALPVRGTLAGVVLDVFPAGTYPGGAQKAEAGRALEAMGVKLAGEGADEGGGLLVASVEPEGPADLAGLAAGDRLESLDGVRLLDAADALPSGRHPYAVVGVRRPEPGETFERQVLLRSFRRRGSTDFGLAGALLALAAGAAIFLASPLARALTWRASAAGLGPGWWRPVTPPGALGLSAAVAMGFSALSLAGAGSGAGAEAVSALALGAAVATGLPTSGAGGVGPAWRRVWAVVRRAVLGAVPVAASWACAAALAGSLWVADVVNVQGGWPWQWSAFASPLGLLLAALFVSPAFLGGGATSPGAARRAPSRREWALGLARAGLAVTWFGGGWRLPGVDAAEQASRLGWRAAGSFVFLLKIWALALALEAVRRAASVPPGAVSAARAEARWARAWWPLAALAVALSAAAVAWPPAAWAPGALGWATFGAAACAGAFAAAGAARGARRVPVSPAL